MLAAMQHALPWTLLGFMAVGCGGDDARQIDGAVGTAALAVTSTAFVEGGTIPVTHTCKDVNTSPPLAWTGAPSGTQSFAVVLTDLSLSPVLVHWVIYDIAPAATGLPAGVENVYAPGNVAGAHQAVSVHAPIVGYYGPCPPSQHTYELAAYALDVATLPGATAQTSRADALTAIMGHKLGSGTLTGTYTPP
jgi:Raf kinase inhibitor-like YbhB/YbcL family protein